MQFGAMYQESESMLTPGVRNTTLEICYQICYKRNRNCSIVFNLQNNLNKKWKQAASRAQRNTGEG